MTDAIARYEAKQAAIEQAMYRLENDIEALGAMWYDEIKPLLADDTPPARLLFAPPTTGVKSSTPNVWGLDWFDATGYTVPYGDLGHYHTGADLNRPNFADAGSQIHAAANGRVVFSGTVPAWQGQVVVVKHLLEDGAFVWTRYAHIRDVVPIGQVVKRGDRLGVIADYTPAGVKGDHLHFDIARINLGEKPGDWPGKDKARVISDYIEPVQWLKDRAG
jgi:murein DD-endopeptidase MepM/ murein hydrolase activator NlpD